MLKQGAKVKIQMPLAAQQKFPAFARAFEGARGKFIGDITNTDKVPVWPIKCHSGFVAGLVAIDISKPGDARTAMLRIDRHWIAAQS